MTREALRTLVLGDTRQGKSYWTKRQLDALPPTKPLIVWDPNAEYAGPRQRDGLKGCSAFQGFEAARAALAKAVLPRIAVQCGLDADDEFRALCKLVFAAGHCTFVVDEAHDVCAQGRIPREFLHIVRKTTHRQIDLWVIAHRPYVVSPDCRNQMTQRTVLFHLADADSWRWADRERAAGLSELVKRLKPREFVIWPGPGGNVKPMAIMKRPAPSVVAPNT